MVSESSPTQIVASVERHWHDLDRFPFWHSPQGDQLDHIAAGKVGAGVGARVGAGVGAKVGAIVGATVGIKTGVETHAVDSDKIPRQRFELFATHWQVLVRLPPTQLPQADQLDQIGKLTLEQFISSDKTPAQVFGSGDRQLQKRLRFPF